MCRLPARNKDGSPSLSSARRRTTANPAVCTGPTFVQPNLDNGLLSDGAIPTFGGEVNALISPGLNHYNSFYVQLQRRAARGLSFSISELNGPRIFQFAFYWRF